MSEQQPKHRFASVQHCSSCGQDHDSVEFQPVRGAAIKAGDGQSYGWYGTCPVTGDPILMRDESGPRSKPTLGGEERK